MPELPEMQALAERLDSALAGATLTGVEPLQFSALKTFDPPLDSIVRHGKEGLLYPPGDVDALVSAIRQLAGDPEMRDLMLLEGRRIRKVGGRILVTNGYAEFSQFIEDIVKELQTQGRLVPELSIAAVRTILVGTFESMMREQVLSYRGVSGSSLKTEEIRAGFDVVLKALLR